MTYVQNMNNFRWKQMLFYLAWYHGYWYNGIFRNATVVQLKSTNICFRRVKRFRFPEGTIITSGTIVHTRHEKKGSVRIKSSGMRSIPRE